MKNTFIADTVSSRSSRSTHILIQPTMRVVLASLSLFVAFTAAQRSFYYSPRFGYNNLRNIDINSGQYIHDDSGRYIPDYSGTYSHDGLGNYAGDRTGDYTGDQSGQYVHIVPREPTKQDPRFLKKDTSIIPGAYGTGESKIIRQLADFDANGYHWEYETENGINAEESGKLHNIGTKQEGIKAKGVYEYIGPDDLYKVEYTADENGFIPLGDHLPDQIVKALDHLRSHNEPH